MQESRSADTSKSSTTNYINGYINGSINESINRAISRISGDIVDRTCLKIALCYIFSAVGMRTLMWLLWVHNELVVQRYQQSLNQS